jgi:hypothetical protein
MKILLILTLVSALWQLPVHAQKLPDNVVVPSPPVDAEKLLKSGRSLKTAGFITGSGGLVLMLVGIGQMAGEAGDATINLVGAAVGVPPTEEVDENKGVAASWIGLTMLLGGTTMVLVGSGKMRKARRMQHEQGISLHPGAPAIKMGKYSLAQHGITLGLRIGR